MDNLARRKFHDDNIVLLPEDLFYAVEAEISTPRVKCLSNTVSSNPHLFQFAAESSRK